MLLRTMNSPLKQASKLGFSSMPIFLSFHWCYENICDVGFDIDFPNFNFDFRYWVPDNFVEKNEINMYM